MIFKRLALVGACVISLGFAVVSGSAEAASPPHPVYISIVTDQGPIVVLLDPVRAPGTVKNFLHYVDTGFFSGGTFFRAVPGFVIQGGNKDRESGADVKIPLETPLKTGIMNTDGAIAMARTADPNSATSEFFIDDGPQSFLDGTAQTPGYAAFGHVVKGMAIVRKIAHMPAEDQMLVTPVKILKIVRTKGP
jgi:peptidyl-prolyl cis-trans isomerase A (cyclophilin A)